MPVLGLTAVFLGVLVKVTLWRGSRALPTMCGMYKQLVAGLPADFLCKLILVPHYT